MWIKFYGEPPKPGIKYQSMPQEEFDALIASHTKLVKALKATYKGYKKKSTGEINTVQEIANIHKLARQALKEAENVK